MYDDLNVEPTPVKKGQGLTTIELVHLLRWYTDAYTDEQAAKKFNTELNLYKDYATYFKVNRILAQGFKLPHASEKTYLRLKTEYENVMALKNQKSENSITPKIDIQAATKAKAMPFLDDIEVQLDKLLLTPDLEKDFNWFEFLKNKDIKGMYIPHIIETIKADSQKYSEFPDRFNSVIADLEKLQTSVSASRKPRRKRTIKADKIVSKIQYLKTDAKLKITSIDPQKIVGAQSLWVYMVNRKYLTHFVADGPNGLTMSGSTVKGFNPEQSLRKKLRKPEDMVKIVMESRASKAHKELEKLTTKTKEVSGRINEETLLLRAE